jgi:hypothetical protein
MPAALGGSNTIAGRCWSEMPRYFFHVRRSDVTVFDREGVELTGIAEAKPRGGDVRSRQGMLRLAPASALVESSSKKDGAPSWNCHSDRLPAVHRRCDVGAPLAQRPSVSMAPAVRVASHRPVQPLSSHITARSEHGPADAETLHAHNKNLGSADCGKVWFGGRFSVGTIEHSPSTASGV